MLILPESTQTELTRLISVDRESFVKYICVHEIFDFVDFGIIYPRRTPCKTHSVPYAPPNNVRDSILFLYGERTL